MDCATEFRACRAGIRKEHWVAMVESWLTFVEGVLERRRTESVVASGRIGGA
jgi:hypothetical protein